MAEDVWSLLGTVAWLVLSRMICGSRLESKEVSVWAAAPEVHTNAVMARITHDGPLIAI
jgi:hypothetical protein